MSKYRRAARLGAQVSAIFVAAGRVAIEAVCSQHVHMNISGCTFAPTIEICECIIENARFMHLYFAANLNLMYTAGPGLLDCLNGRCTQYTTNDDFDCGDKIELASDSWGSFETLLDGDNIVHYLHGYDGIVTNVPIEIPEECTFDCSGCTFQPL